MVSENTPPDEGQNKDESVKPADGAKKKDEKKVVELSEEDLQIKENLELLVERTAYKKAGVAKLAMETMRSEIKSATR